jgi:hypothetical protein
LNADQRWRLVIAAVKAMQHPIQPGNGEGCAEAWVGIVFSDAAVE